VVLRAVYIHRAMCLRLGVIILSVTGNKLSCNQCRLCWLTFFPSRELRSERNLIFWAVMLSLHVCVCCVISSGRCHRSVVYDDDWSSDI